MPDIHTVIRRSMRLSDPTLEIDLRTPLCFSDKAAHAFIIPLLNDDNTAASLTGLSVSGIFVRADNNDVSLTGSVSGNETTVVLSTGCYQHTGRFVLTIKLSQGTSIIRTLAIVRGRTMADTGDTHLDPEHVMPSLPELIAQADASIAAMQAQASTSIAAVEAKGAETLASIPSDYTSLSNEVVNTKAAVNYSADLSTAGIFAEKGYAGKYRALTINSNNIYSSSGNGTHILIPINPGDSIGITANVDQATTYAVLTDFDKPVHLGTPSFSAASGFTTVLTLSKRDRVTFAAPSDAAYLYLTNTISTTVYLPQSVRINGYPAFIGVYDKLYNVQDQIYGAGTKVPEPSVSGKYINNVGAVTTDSTNKYSVTSMIELPETAYMVCVIGELVDYAGISIVALYSDSAGTNCVAHVSPAGENVYLPVPSTARYVCFTSNTKSGMTVPVDRYICCKPKSLYEYTPPPYGYIITESEYTPAFIDGQYIGSTGQYAGQIISIPSKPGFKCTNFIHLDSDCACIVIRGGNIVTSAGIMMIAFYESADDDTFISGISPAGEDIVAYVPENAEYCVIGSNSTGSGTYNPLEGEILFISDKSGGASASEAKASLELPSQYDLVINDTFELFYKGIINSAVDKDFYVEPSCAVGSPYERLFSARVTTAGTYPITLKLRDGKNVIQDEKTINLVVHSVPSSPGSNKNILCVGDSLTVHGEWVKELKRRLTGTGGTPSGNGLSNITFIGTCEADGTNYEGYGGWTFVSYNTANESSSFKLITATHDKTEHDDQHSIYADSNGAAWELETISEGQIKIILESGSASSFPSSGTLTWLSGGEHHSNIVYTASQNAPGNPFWDSTQNKVDFSAYASRISASGIDYLCVLLGWNSTTVADNTYKTQVQTFIDNVQDSYPNAKILLIGLEAPSQDGLAKNYGANATTRPVLGSYIKSLQYVFNRDKLYDEVAADNTNVYHINLSGQFDTEYNMQTGTRRVNARNATTENYQVNGVHPADSGYLQIADAVYRFLCGVI